MAVVGIRNVAMTVLLGMLTSGQVWAQEKAGGENPNEPKPANVVFRLVADATLTVDGEKTTQTGSTRRFVTPPLKAGRKYAYNAVAVWEPNNYTRITRSRKFHVVAGGEVEVDLRKEDPAQPDHIFVRYVPTPQAVVDAMLKLGKVSAGDVVYDLGCGDGRIPITAVSKFSAKRGVGVDLDPQRIKESRENAKRDMVEDKVEFRQEDVTKLKDIKDATVVTLYLGEDLNRLLKPILLKELKPGTRVVSHRFLMGDWKPEKTEELTVSGVKFKLHYWTIPARDK
ncbi:MAG: TIGR03000 domain-containing protein [Gemmataceae bacterium]